MKAILIIVAIGYLIALAVTLHGILTAKPSPNEEE